MKNKTLSLQEIMQYVEAFCSCAIEGNKLGIYMCELWNKDREKFIRELIKLKEETCE